MRTDRASNLSFIIVRLLVIISGMSPFDRQRSKAKSSRAPQAGFWLLHANFEHDFQVKCRCEQKDGRKKAGTRPGGGNLKGGGLFGYL
ncbi:MAG TPA: hypothetical protein VF616_13295 [Duganella sp.]|uniref:hypothetical protein n=1 Tax=Duganella sp. TaxID=1904440 RepID=UPI002ED57B1D